MDRICKIIVVEDDAAVRSLLGDVLDYIGYEFTLVATGAQMRTALEQERFDVAIIDIALRGSEDGFMLAEVASQAGCGVVLTTGDHTQRARLEGSGQRHLLKPFRMQQLTDLAEQLIRDAGATCVTRPKREPSRLPADL